MPSLTPIAHGHAFETYRFIEFEYGLVFTYRISGRSKQIHKYLNVVFGNLRFRYISKGPRASRALVFGRRLNPRAPFPRRRRKTDSILSMKKIQTLSFKP